MRKMTEEKVLQDNKTVEQIVDDMNLFDDDLMSMVFDGNIEAAGLLLKIVLKRDGIIIISVVGQREFQSPVVGGRNIRLDILAKDNTGKYYNIEVQRKPEGAHIRRARFNSSMMDSRMLKEGQEFSELRDSYMVGKLMHDFGCKNSRDIYYPELAKGVKHFKEEEGGRKAMCEAVEKYAEKKVAVKVKEERSLMTQIVAALVADKDDDTIIKELNCTLEQIIPLRTVMGK